MIALAIADNAFENKFTSLAQIYNLKVPSTTDRIRLKWDKDWAEQPIFRDVEKTPGYEDSTSKTQPIFEDDKGRVHDALLENARKKTRGGKGSTRHRSLTSQDAEKQIIPYLLAYKPPLWYKPPRLISPPLGDGHCPDICLAYKPPLN